jgi:hypothetical protein
MVAPAAHSATIWANRKNTKVWFSLSHDRTCSTIVRDGVLRDFAGFLDDGH